MDSYYLLETYLSSAHPFIKIRERRLKWRLATHRQNVAKVCPWMVKIERFPEKGEQGESCRQFTLPIRCPSNFGQYVKALLQIS
jgi:hypothetical protein